MIRLSRDERRIVSFLTFILLAAAVIQLARKVFPVIDECLGFRTRSEIVFKNMTPADSAELAGLLARAKGTVEEERVTFPIDLNTATEENLVLLPGIGPAKAAAILERRERRGGFEAVEELLDVKGIGPKTLEKLRTYVFIREDQVESE